MTKMESRTIDLINEVYKNSAYTGALHIVLDDGNFEDAHIQWCLENGIEDIEDKEIQSVYKECAENLLKMKLSRRYYCVRIADEKRGLEIGG